MIGAWSLDIRRFASLVSEARRDFPGEFCSRRVWMWYPLWRYTLNRSDGLESGRPWITFEAARFLSRVLAPHMRVLEWGTGGSTVFFARRVAEVESVEHEKAWLEKVDATLKSRGLRNVRLNFRPPVAVAPDAVRRKDRPEDYASGTRQYPNHDFRDYAAFADTLPSECFDLVVIDGRARPSCFVHGYSKVRPGGYLMLDDAQRGHYVLVHERLNAMGWLRVPFYGPGPYGGDFRFTCLWHFPKDRVRVPYGQAGKRI